MAEPVRTLNLDSGPVEVLDRGEGPAVLLLHGALSNAHTWRAVLGPLSERHRCIAPTLPLGGHRVPMPESADLSPAGMAEVIRQLVDAVGQTSVAVVGNDTGGAYAQVFAASHPSRVSRLVLCNCDALDVFPPAQFASLQSAINLPFYGDLMALAFRIKPFLASPWALGLLSKTLSPDEIRAHYVDAFIRDRRIRRDFRAVATGWSTQATEAAATRLASLDIPTLLLWGTDDALFPLELANRLHARLPGSRLTLVEDARTYVQIDQPDRFVEHVLSFLSD